VLTPLVPGDFLEKMSWIPGSVLFDILTMFMPFHNIGVARGGPKGPMPPQSFKKDSNFVH